MAEAQSGGDEWEKHGTIGAWRAMPKNIAAGTSTGGITNQMHGRVGDSPLPGCGTFANQSTVAVSCTGIGEAFIKVVAAIRCRIVCVSPARTSRMPRRPLWTKSPRIMAMVA